MKMKLAYGPKESIDSKISDNTLNEGTMVFTEDTNEMVLVDKDKNQVPLAYRIKEDITVKGSSIGSYADGEVIPAGTTVEEILKHILQKEYINVKAPFLFWTTTSTWTTYTQDSYVNPQFLETYYSQTEINKDTGHPTVEGLFPADYKSFVGCVPEGYTLNHIKDSFSGDTHFETICEEVDVTATINGYETKYKCYYYSNRQTNTDDCNMIFYLDAVEDTSNE